jgi:subtilisin-like proprotein convertase family protein
VAAPQAVKASVVVPSVPASPAEPQLDLYTYGATSVYGSNIPLAWQHSTGAGVAIGFVDDGFDPATVATYANFSTALSVAFPSGSTAEPSGGFHGTTTTGLVAASGTNGTPMGLAPNATIVGVKVTFSTATISVLAQAELYAAENARVVNNSWGFSTFGAGGTNNPLYGTWYANISYAVSSARGGLGDAIVFAAGNERQTGQDLSVEPLTADYRVIAVAATNANGTVAYYSDSGAALLVAAIGDNVAVPQTGGSGSTTDSGTSYSSPAVAAIAALMLSVNATLGWRDIQEILADSAYAPPPSASGFTYNGGTTWNGGGMHFSNDLGFGVVDANVAVNLARAWTAQSTSANLVSATVTNRTSFAVGANGTASSSVTVTAAVRIQHVQVTMTDNYLPAAYTKLVLIAPDGTRSVLMNQAGLSGGTDNTGGLDVSGSTITTNAFWGETAAGTWTLQVQDIGGARTGTIRNFTLTILGDNAATVSRPLVYTPEFARIATPGREVVSPGTAKAIDLIALPDATNVNLNGGAGTIDGVAVTLGTGLTSAYANGSTGSVTLTGLTSGGSTLSGGDGTTTIAGYGHDTIAAGLGTTAIDTGAGGSYVALSNTGSSHVTVASGGGDTIFAGLATVSVTDTGREGDTITPQGSALTFINGSGPSTVNAGTGIVTVQAGAGGGTYYAGTAGGSSLAAGPGLVTFYGAAAGDILTASGSAADKLVGGAGAETLSGSDSTGAITIQAGSGADTMIAGKGRTTFILGTGNSSVAMGGIADIIQIQSGQAGGRNTVSGFRIGIDDIHLIGFFPLAVGNAVNNQTPDGSGGTLLSFNDGTRLDLVGIGRIGISSFV